MAFNILIVDDSGVMRAMIKKTLSLSGLELGEVLEGANGKEGLDILASHWIDLVIADINMPVMDGEQMVDAMKNEDALRDIPVLVVSTEGSETRINRLKEKGVHFLRKPFTPELLRDTILKILGVLDDGKER